MLLLWMVKRGCRFNPWSNPMDGDLNKSKAIRLFLFSFFLFTLECLEVFGRFRKALEGLRGFNRLKNL